MSYHEDNTFSQSGIKLYQSMDFHSALGGIFFLSGIKWFVSVTLNLTLTKIITIYFAGGLSWYVHDAAHVISTKIAKKPFHGNDRGEKLIISGVYIVMGWLWIGESYECVQSTAKNKNRPCRLGTWFVRYIYLPN